MERLTHSTLEKIGYDGFALADAPIKVLQFGEGNFLRAFVDYFFDVLNEKGLFNGKITMVQPIERGLTDIINEQEGLYTLYLRGAENGKPVMQKRIITSVDGCLSPYSRFDSFIECAKNPDLRYIVSNTTEAGIAYSDSDKFDDRPANTFPAKLTQLMYERFINFGSQAGKGFVILSCELIDNNGRELLNCVDKYINLWKLPKEFSDWVHSENIFCSTLVDRIVTGYPRNEADEFNKANGYEDKLLDTGEIFGFWVIEGPEKLKSELPFEKAGLPVLICDDHTPYKKRKVRILNGAHTSLAPAAMLAGETIVRDCMNDAVLSKYVAKLVHDEIIPIIPLPKDELLSFADAVEDRFKNPYIDHRLTDITLNSVSKWRARVMPSLIEYVEKSGNLPKLLTFSLAGLIRFYRCTEKNGAYFGKGEYEYTVRDSGDVCEYFSKTPSVKEILANKDFWGIDLNSVDGLCERVEEYIAKTDGTGVKETLKTLLGE